MPSFRCAALYESRRLSTRLAESMDALKATSLSTVCLAVVAATFSVRMITVPFLMRFTRSALSLVIASRFFMQYWLAIVRRHGHNLRYMLILGTNSRAIEFARKIEAAPERGYQLLGFVDEDWPKMSEFNATGYKLCCDYAGLAEYLRRNVVDEVAIYLPLRSFYEHSSQVAALCEQHGMVMRFASDIFGLKTAHSRTEEFDGDPSHRCLHRSARWLAVGGQANLWTVTISSALLIVLPPLFLVVAALIKLTSNGPVFFCQERLGVNKRRFRIYKFRTMVPNAEEMLGALEDQNEVSGPVFKIMDDPRITAIGKFLRRTSIDELPQLFNVLKGDMSLVGPRPLPGARLSRFQSGLAAPPL